MSSDLLCFENTFYSSSDFFSDTLSFGDILDDPIKPHLLDQNVPDFSSSPPPCQQMGNLTLSQNTPFQNFQNFQALSNGVVNFSGLNMNSQVLGHGSSCDSRFGHNNNGFDMNQNLQRSFSSKSFTEDCGAFNADMYFPSLQLEESPEKAFFSSQLRRVYSTGDLQEKRSPQMMHRPCMDEANFKVGRYSADERRERILKYRAKRSQRNFNKTIKYACRKALADNRPRIRGRFARNDEIGETPNTALSTKDEEDDYLWVEGFNVEDFEGTTRGGQFMNNVGPTKFQYYGH